MHWKELRIDKAPAVSGVYAIKHRDKWLYIGKSKNISVRVKTNPAFLLTQDLTYATYWYIESDNFSQLEAELIERYKPEWYSAGCWRIYSLQKHRLLEDRSKIIWISSYSEPLPKSRLTHSVAWDKANIDKINISSNRKFLLLEEVQLLMSSAKKYRKKSRRNYVLVLLCFRHGLRISEACALEWTDIDFKNRTIFIKRGKRGINGYHCLKEDEVFELLELKKETSVIGSYVFRSERGTKLTPEAAAKIINRLGEAANFDVNIHPHMLRHSCAFHLASQSVPVEQIQSYLGHVNIENTMVYIDVASLPPMRVDWWTNIPETYVT